MRVHQRSRKKPLDHRNSDSFIQNGRKHLASTTLSLSWDQCTTKRDFSLRKKKKKGNQQDPRNPHHHWRFLQSSQTLSLAQGAVWSLYDCLLPREGVDIVLCHIGPHSYCTAHLGTRTTAGVCSALRASSHRILPSLKLCCF